MREIVRSYITLTLAIIGVISIGYA